MRYYISLEALLSNGFRIACPLNTRVETVIVTLEAFFSSKSNKIAILPVLKRH